jgi:hypothetical protein
VPKSRKAINPFYGLLVVVGVLFVITACAYFVMTLRDAKPELKSTAHPLLAFVEKHGLTALIAELAVLGVATFGAIGTDDYWERRRRKQVAAEGGEDSHNG